MSSKRGAVPARPSPRAKGHGGQRQHLIEACISALHVFGPSRTTVAKVVAIAKMSPGIVRFYFDSKAAMLVASLEFLAAEFEQQVLVPVAKLVSSPIIALELLIDRYVDPHLASPRKVSVWYAFWGEASSRQEYYDICGQKDDRFAALVLELVEGVVAETGLTHLDADGIALGLIGGLEILWQDFAFRREQDIDRPAAKRRCRAYLNSVFPGCFDRAEKKGHAVSGFRSWVYNDAALLALERRVLFQEAWTLIGMESQVEEPGEFLTADTGAERALVIRGASGSLAAVRNNCPASAHALVADRSGRLVGSIACALHGLRFGLDGKGLVGVEMQSVGGLIFIRSPGMRPRDQELLAALASAGVPAKLTVVGDAVDVDVRANWKVVVEQWLD
ncbi:MAG: TetR family transcriptional regulator C-terminal domain-containing protein, partial [Pseudomonadota bacterium]|nr:TetR family transcriptional regulator C-terminal domain-containing protein [Pseudomonadota bacterium]